MGTLINGIKEIFATSQGTATHLPVCASDGTPQGRISASDLASVLGVPIKQFKTINIDETYSTGIYQGNRCTGTFPDGSELWGSGSLLLVFSADNPNSWVVQYHFAFDNNAWCYVRQRFNEVWSEWNKISYNVPAFYNSYANIASLVTGISGASNLSTLASAMGGSIGGVWEYRSYTFQNGEPIQLPFSDFGSPCFLSALLEGDYHRTLFVCGYRGGWYNPSEIKTNGDKIYYHEPPTSDVPSGIYIYAPTHNTKPCVVGYSSNTQRIIRIWYLR